MRAGDVFPPYKALAKLVSIHYVLKPTEECEPETYEELNNFIKKGIDFAHAEFGNTLVFCHIQEIEQNNISIDNTSILPFVNPEISIITDGEKEGLIVDYIKYFCPNVEIQEGEIRKIKSLAWKQTTTA